MTTIDLLLNDADQSVLPAHIVKSLLGVISLAAVPVIAITLLSLMNG